MEEQIQEEEIQEEKKGLNVNDKFEIEDKLFIVKKKVGKNLVLKNIPDDEKKPVDRTVGGVIYGEKQKKPIEYKPWNLGERFEIDGGTFKLNKVVKKDFWFKRV